MNPLVQSILTDGKSVADACVAAGVSYKDGRRQVAAAAVSDWQTSIRLSLAGVDFVAGPEYFMGGWNYASHVRREKERK